MAEPGPRENREGLEQVRNGRRYRFTGGRWVDLGPVAPATATPPPNQSGAGHGPIDPNEIGGFVPPPKKEIDLVRREPNVPAVVLPPPTDPPPTDPPPPETPAAVPTGLLGAVMYAPSAQHKGYIMRYVWNAASNKYVAERAITQAEWAAIQGGTGDGKFYGDSTHEYRASSDGNMVDRTLANDIYSRTNRAAAVVPDPGGQQVGTGLGMRAADVAAVQAGTSVVSGRTGTGPIVPVYAPPVASVNTGTRSPWRPKPILQPGETATWDPVTGRWTLRRFSANRPPPRVVPPVSGYVQPPPSFPKINMPGKPGSSVYGGGV